jgi:hypothetical protein
MAESRKTPVSLARAEKLKQLFEYAFKIPKDGWPGIQYEHGMEMLAAVISDTCEGFTNVDAVAFTGRNVSTAGAVGIANRGRYGLAFNVNKVGLTVIARDYGIELMLNLVKPPGSVGMAYSPKSLKSIKIRVAKERDDARRLKIENQNKLKALRDERKK